MYLLTVSAKRNENKSEGREGGATFENRRKSSGSSAEKEWQ